MNFLRNINLNQKILIFGMFGQGSQKELWIGKELQPIGKEGNIRRVPKMKQIMMIMRNLMKEMIMGKLVIKKIRNNYNNILQTNQVLPNLLDKLFQF